MNARLRPRRLATGLALWLAAITAAHLLLNVDWSRVRNRFAPLDQRKLNIAYIPVT